MIVITIISILLLSFNYDRVADLLHPGFVSLYDRYLFREEFVNSDYILKKLANQYIKDGLFGEITTQIKGMSGPIDFTFAPFWVYVNRWLMAVLLIAIILLVINRVLIAMKLLPEYIADIPVYVMIILFTGGYYLAVKVLGGYEPQNGVFHISALVLVIFCVFAIIFGIIKKISIDRKNNDPEKEKPKKKMILAAVFVIVQALLFIILPGRFMIDAIRLSNDYKSNLGSFDPYKMTVRYDLEKNGFAGNFSNQAVDTKEGLYFIDNEKKLADGESYRTVITTHIRKLDKNGSITDICPQKGDDKNKENYYINIGYADGNIYASTRYDISRINPGDGSESIVITASPDYIIAEMCVVDNRLYYTEIPEQYDSPKVASAWVCEISGDDLSKPQLYTSDLDRGVFTRFEQFDSSSLLTNIVIGDYIKDRYWQGGRYQICDGRSFYVMEGYKWNDEHVPTQLIIKDDSNPDNWSSIEKVGGFNVYNESIYYIQLKENGLDVCKCDLDGSNIEVIDTYTCDKDLSKNDYQSIYRVMIGQGKIYVVADGRIFPEEEFSDTWNLYLGAIRFMTDLK